jgi:hypothetical protein
MVRMFCGIFFMMFILLLDACEDRITIEHNFSAWNEEKVYGFLNEVLTYTQQITRKTYPSKEEIIREYQKYFTPELSGKIVNSLFIKSVDGWMVPDGDSGYIFMIPVKGEDEQSSVIIDIQKELIQLKVTYEIGMFSLIQYKIQYLDKPIITEWILQ